MFFIDVKHRWYQSHMTRSGPVVGYSLLAASIATIVSNPAKGKAEEDIFLL